MGLEDWEGGGLSNQVLGIPEPKARPVVSNVLSLEFTGSFISQ